MKQTQERPIRARSENRIRRSEVYADGLRHRYNERLRKRKRQIAAIRSVVTFLLLLIMVCIILFMTPLFNIRRITVSGNDVISLEEINQYIGDLNGENLLKTDRYDVEERLSGIAYIKSIDVSKNYFKTSLDITITERDACGYLGFSGKYVLFDEECVILAEATQKPEGIPLIIGTDDTEGETVVLDKNKENIAAMIECVSLMRDLGILDKVNNIDVSDVAEIRFEYEQRLDVLCGGNIDLERKLRLFEAMINNNNLASNAQGTVDLSITGNARYSPDKAKSIKSAEGEISSKKQSSQKNEE